MHSRLHYGILGYTTLGGTRLRQKVLARHASGRRLNFLRRTLCISGRQCLACWARGFPAAICTLYNRLRPRWLPPSCLGCSWHLRGLYRFCVQIVHGNAKLVNANWLHAVPDVGEERGRQLLRGLRCGKSILVLCRRMPDLKLYRQCIYVCAQLLDTRSGAWGAGDGGGKAMLRTDAAESP